jgi:YesN/AraC family two-component response regulator
MKADLVRYEDGSNLNFPSHIHSSFEIVVITKGELQIILNDKEETLREGECALIFPNQIHAFKTEKSSQHMICIFSPQLVRAYGKIFDFKVPKRNKFVLDKFYQDKIREIKDITNTMELKGILYSICAEFDKQAEYVEAKADKNNLLFTIFKFVEENYAKECSLYSLADKTSYNYVYLSKHFSKCTKMTYTEYVNRYRINEACYLLINTNNTMLDIAYECGFDCLRSFNRNFKKIMGVSPTEYKELSIPVLS